MSLLRTLLFVPGNRPDRIEKAFTSTADCVIVDLEDAVAVSEKADARQLATAAVATHALVRSGSIAVRVNGFASGLLREDLAALVEVWQHVRLIILPMTEEASSVAALAGMLAENDLHAGVGTGPLIVPLVETAAGVLAAPAIATADPRVATLALGPADLSAQLGVALSAAGTELLVARSQLVLASAAAGLTAPIDGPWLNLDDEDGLRRSTESARDLGFGGKMVLHPRQLSPVTEVFSPSAKLLAWAAEVDNAFSKAELAGVASIRLPDGTFVDYPVARRARAILAGARG